MWSGGSELGLPASRPHLAPDHQLDPASPSAATMDSAETYYPPPADWNFAAPTVLSEWDARSEPTASPLGEANFLRSAEWWVASSCDGRRLGLTAVLLLTGVLMGRRS